MEITTAPFLLTAGPAGEPAGFGLVVPAQGLLPVIRALERDDPRFLPSAGGRFGIAGAAIMLSSDQGEGPGQTRIGAVMAGGSPTGFLPEPLHGPYLETAALLLNGLQYRGTGTPSPFSLRLGTDDGYGGRFVGGDVHPDFADYLRSGPAPWSRVAAVIGEVRGVMPSTPVCLYGSFASDDDISITLSPGVGSELSVRYQYRRYRLTTSNVESPKLQYLCLSLLACLADAYVGYRR